MFKRRKGPDDGPTVTELVRRGAELLDTDLDAAEQCYRRALEFDDSIAEAWFDLGLIHKWRREWPAALECNRRAVELRGAAPGSQDPAHWNAGIAATALADWDAARWAWREYGVTLPDGDGEIDGNFGLGVVRLPIGETVWGRRIDPARMRILSIPLPDSGFRCGDIVLHDGARDGARVHEGTEYPVFPVIERLRRSDVPTVELVVEASESDVEVLVAMIGEIDGGTAENWTSSVEMECAACSHGRIDYDHPDHEHPAPVPGGVIRIGCSADAEALAEVIRTWEATTAGLVRSRIVFDS